MNTVMFPINRLFYDARIGIPLLLAFIVIDLMVMGRFSALSAFILVMIFVIYLGMFGYHKLYENILNAKISGYLPDSEHSHIIPFAKRAIAISPTSRKILLVDGNSHKVCSFDEIRSWEIKNFTGGTFNTAGAKLTTQIDTSKVNAKIRMKNEAESGIYVKVKDIKKPEWMFPANLDVQNSWMEILTQYINES
jgi:Ca2+/Na+ antiporter